jgi:hypothetical protein
MIGELASGVPLVKFGVVLIQPPACFFVSLSTGCILVRSVRRGLLKDIGFDGLVCAKDNRSLWLVCRLKTLETLRSGKCRATSGTLLRMPK